MASPTRGKRISIVQQIERAFNHMNDLDGPNEGHYLRKLARNDPKLFISLVNRIIPQEIKSNVGLTSVTVNLGLAIQEALTRVPGATPAPLDITPVAPTAPLEPVLIAEPVDECIEDVQAMPPEPIDPSYRNLKGNKPRTAAPGPLETAENSEKPKGGAYRGWGEKSGPLGGG